jgi:hypothetical protein
MPLAGVSIGTVAGLAIAVVFAVLCRRNMPRAILVFAGIGWIQFIRVFDLPGSRITQNLLLVEVLASVMILVWWLGRLRAPRPPLLPTPFNRPLFLMIPLSLISLIWSLGGQDPSIPGEHVKLAVSLGQVLLIVWPVGLYVVVANSILDTATMRSIVRLIVLMAIPSVALTLVPSAWRAYIGWSINFALVASPICFAASFDARAPLRKLGLLILAISPIVYGLSIGKAFLYVTAAAGLATVAFLRARRLLLVAVFVGLGLYVLMAVSSGSLVPKPFQALIDVERQQQTAGRDDWLSLPMPWRFG